MTEKGEIVGGVEIETTHGYVWVSDELKDGSYLIKFNAHGEDQCVRLSPYIIEFIYTASVGAQRLKNIQAVLDQLDDISGDEDDDGTTAEMPPEVDGGTSIH